MNLNTLSRIVIVLLLVYGCKNADPAPPDAARVPAVSQQIPGAAMPVDGTAQAPDFVVPDLKGDSLRLADFEGKTLLVNFWATWCGPCIAEIPDLIALQEELGEEQFAVIGLSMDLIEKDIVQEFVESMEITYPIGIDEGQVAEAFGGVYSLPTTFVIDKQGFIKQRTIGIFPTEAFKPHLISLIEAD